MKPRFIVAVMLFSSLLFFANTNLAQAQWDAISSGYAVTTNWHGQEVPLDEEVTAIAGTTDSEVEKVEFRWLDPGGNTVWEDLVDVFGPYITPDVPDGVPQEIIEWANDNPGVSILYANDTRTLNVLGDWAVQTNFIDPDNHVKSLRGRNTDIVAIRATSFNVVPEVPFGTIVISLSMFGILGVFKLKRKHKLSARMPS